MPLKYRQVKDIYDQLHKAGVVTSTLPEWSAQQNADSGTDFYSEGLHDNFIKRTSVGLDRLLEATGLPEGGKAVGGYLGGLIGDRKTGEAIGEGTARGALDFAPLLIPGPQEVQGARLLFNAAKYGLGAALPYASAYTDTGSPAAGVVSAATNIAMPGVAGAAEKYVLGKMGAKLIAGPLEGADGVVRHVSTRMAETIPQKLVAGTAGQVAAAGLGVGSTLTQQALAGEPLSVNPTEVLLGATVGQLPFLGLHAGKKLIDRATGAPAAMTPAELQKAIDLTQGKLDAKAALERANARTPLENIPDIEEPTPMSAVQRGQHNFILNDLLNRQKELEKINTPESIDELQKLRQQEADLIRGTQGDEGTAGIESLPGDVAGRQMSEDTARQNVTGTTHYVNPKTGYKIVKVGDEEGNGDLAGKLIGYPLKFEPPVTRDPETGQEVHSVPLSYYNEHTDRTIKAPSNEAQLELGKQENPASNLFDHVHELQIADQEITAAETVPAFHAAVQRLNAVRQNYGIAPLDDRAISKRMKWINLTQPKDAVKGAIAETQRQIEAQQAHEKAVVESANFAADLHARANAVDANGESVGDPIAKSILELRDRFTRSSGRRDALVSSGLFDKVAKEWYENGGQDLSELKVKFAAAIAHGTGMTKVPLPKDSVIEKANEVAKEHTPESEVIAQTLEEKAAEVSAGGDKNLRQLFVLLAREGALNDLDVASEVIKEASSKGDFSAMQGENKVTANRSTMDEIEARDEARTLFESPEFREWTQAMDEGTKVVSKRKTLIPDNEKAVAAAYKTNKGRILSGKTHGLVMDDVENGTIPLEQGEIVDQNVEGFLTNKGNFVDREVAASLNKVKNSYQGDGKMGSKDLLPSQKNSPMQGTESPSYIPEDGTEAKTIQSVGSTGLDTFNHLIRPESDNVVKSLMDGLRHFGESLSRIKVRFVDSDEASTTYHYSDGRVEVELSRNLLKMLPDARDRVIVHELVHGLTIRELDNPTNAKHVEELNAIREKLVESLPKDLREIYDKAIESGWQDRYVRGEDVEPLHDDPDKANLLYAMLDNHELISQMFSSEPVRNFLKSKKSTDGQSYYHRFTKWISSLFGLKPGDGRNALDEVLSKSDQILHQGNFVSTLSNFGEKYFRNHGLGPKETRNQTARGVALLTQSEYGLTHGEVISSLDNQAESNPRVKYARTQLANQYKNSPEDFEELNQVLQENGFAPTPQGVEDFLSSHLLGHVPDADLAMDMMPEAATNLIYEKARDMQQVLGMLKGATKPSMQGVLGIANPDLVRKPLHKALNAVEKVLAHEDANDQAIHNIQAMLAAGPMDYAKTNMKKAPPELVPQGEDGKGFWDGVSRFLTKPAQFAKAHPEVAELVSKGYQLAANTRHMIMQGFKAFGVNLETGEITKESDAALQKAIRNPKIRSAVDTWIYINQREGGDRVETLPDTHPVIAKILDKLTPAERNTVIDLISKKEASQRFMNAQILEKQLHISALHGAELIAAKTGLKVSQNLALSAEMLDTVMSDASTPEAQQMIQARLNALQAKFKDPQAYLDLLKFTQNEVAKWKVQKEFFDKNPAWSTAQRYGKYDVIFRDGKNVSRQAVDSRKQAEAMANGRQIVSFERRATGDNAPEYGGLSPDVIKRLRELEANQQDMLKNVMSPEDLAEMKRTSAIEQFATEAQRQGVPVLDPKARRLSKGAEELPWLSNHFSWINSTSNYWSRQLLRTQGRVLANEPELATRPDLQKWAKTHVANILSTDPELARIATRFTTTWFMGLNAASAMANGTQLLTRGVAAMTHLTGKPIESYKRMLNVYHEMLTHGTTGKWATPEHDWVVQKLTHDGERNLSLFDDVGAINDLLANNLKRAITQSGPQTLGQRASSMAGGLGNAAMWMFRQVEQVNNTGAALMAYDHYREQGLTREEAYVKATQFNHEVNDVGGRANRSAGLFDNKDKFSRSAAMTANAMQSYMLGSTGQLIHYLKQGLFRPQGLTPHEVYKARTAGIQMLATQFALAGTLGMPFVSGAIAMLDKAFPGLEINKHLREWIHEFVGDDEDNGNVMGDIALTGIPSMFGWDWQSRLSMGNSTPGVSEINGFQPQLLLGAPVNLVSNFVKGAVDTANGEGINGVKQMLPPAIAKMVGLGQSLSSGKVSDYKGRPVLDPTAGEQLGMALGFNPKRLSDFNAASRMAKASDENVNRVESQFRMDMASEVVKGNFGTVRQAILSKSQQDPNYDPVSAVRSVATAAEELTFPRDLRQEGSQRTSSARAKLLSAFRLDPSQPTEVARLQFRQQVQQRLGLPPSPGAELPLATLMDQLRKARPDATRSELRQAATLALRGKRIRSLLPEEQ